MTGLLAVLTFLTLSVVSVIHVYWAFGGIWPAQDERTLARTVVGAKGIAAMPRPAPTAIVAGLIFLAGAIPLALVQLSPDRMPAPFPEIVIGGLALIFIVRGMASFTGAFHRIFCEEPFVTLDRRYYGPLCLLAGAMLTTICIGIS